MPGLTLATLAPGITVGKLSGHLTAGGALRDIETRLESLVGEGAAKKLILDLTEVESTDSAGVGMLVQTHIAASGAGLGLRLAGANKRVLSVFRMTRLDRVLALFPTTGDAAAEW